MSIGFVKFLVERRTENLPLFNRSMRLRDRGWLYFGDDPEIEYADESVITKKNLNGTEKKQHELERRTASKLNSLGFSTVFQNDEIVNDEGLTIGLPDLSNGVELKTIYEASSENTISKHIGKSKKKSGLSAIVVDVSENNNLDDAKAIEYVRKSIARHNIKFPIYVLKHDGNIFAI